MTFYRALRLELADLARPQAFLVSLVVLLVSLVAEVVSGTDIDINVALLIAM